MVDEKPRPTEAEDLDSSQDSLMSSLSSDDDKNEKLRQMEAKVASVEVGSGKRP